jgi:gliding motility-associated-like protein
LSCVDCATPTANPAAKTTYIVTGSTVYGCTNSDTLVVDVQQPFTMIVNKGDTLCQGSIFQLKASGADKYQWSPALYLDSTNSATPIARPDSTITYNVIGSDKNNCFADTGTVTLNIRPIDIVIDGLTTACEPANLTFKGNILYNDTSTVSWSWDFGNGVISNAQNPSAQNYLKAGSYPVKLIVSTSSGCSGSKETVAQINPIPTVQVGADTTVCRFTPLNLQATGANSYTWNAQPSLSCTICANPVANPTGKTTYTVTGKTLFGCENRDTITVDVQQPFIMTVNKGDTLCEGGVFQLKASGADKYQWSPALYLDNTTSASPMARPDSTITYSVIGRDNNNCFADTGTVTLRVRPIDIIIDGPTSACEPANLTFKGKVSNGDTSTVTWSWDFGNGVISTAQNPSAQKYLKAGSYPVKLFVSTSSGCSGSKETIAQINPVPTVNVGPDSVICKSTSLTLTATGADSYTWDFKPTLNCLNCPSPVAKPDSTTMYGVTGRTSFGCSSRDSLVVRVNQPFKMTIGLGDTLCLGESSILVANGAQTYQWTPSTWLVNPSAGTTKANPQNTITYQVIGKDSIGCFADTGRITLQVYPKPQIDILAGAAINLNVGSKVTLDTKNSPDITKWVWTPAVGLTCINCPNPVATPKETTTYTVSATNNGGCTTSDDVIVTVICNDVNIYIPNTFSPNEDGVNDYFFPRSSSIFTVKTFRIFNRWGQLVYQKNNFNSNAAEEGWDGKMNGQKLTPDVYVYAIEILCGNGSIIPVKGNITLIR